MPDPASAPAGSLNFNEQNAARLHQQGGPACDECRQKKIKCDRNQPTCGHCSKGGLQCEFSNRIRRINHARQLVDDFAGLNDRLASIDNATHYLTTSMNAITQLLQRSSDGRQPVAPPLSPPPTGDPPFSSRHSDSDEQNTSTTLDSVAAEAPRLVQSASGIERYYGSFSTHALFHTARKIVEDLIGQARNGQSTLSSQSTTSDSRAHMTRLLTVLDQNTLHQVAQSFNAWNSVSYDEDDLEATNQPIELPPHFLLQSAIKSFFEETRLEWPIFHTDSVMNAIKSQYGPNQATIDPAWRLCLNNIILIAMAGRPEVLGTTAPVTGQMERGILTSLVNNAKRGFGFAQHLLAPRLVNVQALLSLALVARDYLHYSIFERALFFAFQVASSMGLPEDCSRGTGSFGQARERQNVLWAIYALDKQRCFVRGTSCLLYQFECSVELPTYQQAMFQDHQHAKLQLATVMEDVYRELYSPKVRRRTSHQLEDHVKRCGHRLELWSLKFHSLLETSIRSWTLQTMFMGHIKCSYHACQILIHRRSGYVESQRICVESARKYLDVIQALSDRDSIGQGSIVVLKRIFNSCSIIAYYEIWVQVLFSSSSGSTTDLQRLVDFTKALGLLADSNYPQSYCTRVFRAVNWCTEIARIVQDGKPGDDSDMSGLQVRAQSFASQSGPWQLLAPAFWNTVPYDEDFGLGTVIGFDGQSQPTYQGPESASTSFLPRQPDWGWMGDGSSRFASGNATPFMNVSGASSAMELPLQHQGFGYQHQHQHQQQHQQQHQHMQGGSGHN